MRAAPGPAGSQHHLRRQEAAQGSATRGPDEGDSRVADANHDVGQSGPRHRRELDGHLSSSFEVVVFCNVSEHGVSGHWPLLLGERRAGSLSPWPPPAGQWPSTAC